MALNRPGTARTVFQLLLRSAMRAQAARSILSPEQERAEGRPPLCDCMPAVEGTGREALTAVPTQYQCGYLCPPVSGLRLPAQPQLLPQLLAEGVPEHCEMVAPMLFPAR
jgi:hypothetical protein